MPMLLVPFVEFDKENNKVGVYTGMYNIDMNHIVSVEPDEEGDTIINHKFGPSITINVPCETMLLYIGRSVTVDLSLLEFVTKHDDRIAGFIAENT